MPTHLKNLIVKRLIEFSTKQGLASLSNNELRNLSVLALSYSVGMRPLQVAQLIGSSVKKVAQNHQTKLQRYEVLVSLAKQSRVTNQGIRIALSQEVGILIDEYKSRFTIGADDALYPYKGNVRKTLSKELDACLNKALLFIQNDETKQLIAQNKKLAPQYTLYDFRHNIGHTMSMGGASAEDIASILGHVSIEAGKHYIMSTPELALLKHRALGENPVWQKMMGLLMTGYSVNESDWSGEYINGVLNNTLIERIGGCDKTQDKCHLQKVRSCYGCFYFRPFKDVSKHKQVLKIITDELYEHLAISNDSGNSKNPIIDSATQIKNQIEMVIYRLEGNLR